MQKGIPRFIFVSAFDYPTRFAHALHGLHMARAFAARLGNSFLYIVNTAVEQEELSGIRYRRLFGRSGRRVKKLRLRRLLVPLSLLYIFITQKAHGSVMYTTDPVLFAPLVFMKRFFNYTFACECHGTLTPKQSAIVAQHADAIFFVTASLKNDWIAAHPHAAHKAHLLPNAVDISAFEKVPDDKAALREKLDLPLDKTLVGYVGRFEPLGADKGLHLMIDAVSSLPEEVTLVLVGGAKNEIAHYADYIASKGLADRVTLVPHVASSQVAQFEKACDILAYVPSAGGAFFEKETSPMKLFEYMAADRPIIVSDSPAMREILDDSSALFVKPGSQAEFVHAIEHLIHSPDHGAGLAASALKKVSRNTWERRAQEVLERTGAFLPN